MTDRSLPDIRRLALVIEPPDMLKQHQANQRAVDSQGQVNLPAMRRNLPPITLHWDSGDTSPQRTPRAGTAVLIAAWCATPPSTGDALVTLTDESGGQVGTITIPNGTQKADAEIVMALDANVWIARTITTANGASGVAIDLVLELR